MMRSLREIDCLLKFVIDSLLVSSVEWSYLKTLFICLNGYPDNCHPGQLPAGKLPPLGCRGAGTCYHAFFMFFFLVQWKWKHH